MSFTLRARQSQSPRNILVTRTRTRGLGSTSAAEGPGDLLEVATVVEAAGSRIGREDRGLLLFPARPNGRPPGVAEVSHQHYQELSSFQSANQPCLPSPSAKRRPDPCVEVRSFWGTNPGVARRFAHGQSLRWKPHSVRLWCSNASLAIWGQDASGGLRPRLEDAGLRQ